MIDCRLVLACSGLLGNVALKCLSKEKIISAVLTDKKSTEIINFCSKNRIDCFIGNARNDECIEFVKKYKDDILFSVNYLFLFDEKIISLFRYKFNIHGSLLPKYRGRTPHVWAIINNERKTGITIHDITLECDAGDIFLQKEIPITYHDTGGVILQKYIYHYPRMIKQFLYLFSEQKIVPKKQDEQQKTYFNKRTPEDGRIVWDWQRERIYNWVRALAPPYPGAFCFLGEAKVIINKLRLSDFGFYCDMKNGFILDVNTDSIIVKTPNGCVEILDYISDENIDYIKKGDVLV
ncbi:MAG: methionyl-tRNA formyltransferase [Treponema sp.]|jgi:methionyl-tRNA formyltransferase|nr:methionyl-tRNA formyltransferase [Treponema sp.]